MKKAGSVLITLILLLIIINPIVNAKKDSNSLNNANSNKYEKGYRFNIQGWVYIHIEGEPYERGYQYGYLATEEIVDTLNRWARVGHDIKGMKIFLIKNLPNNYDKLSEQWWDICRLISNHKFLKNVPEEYQQEMRGMVDGLKANEGKIFGRDIDFKDIVAAQFVQEVWYGYLKYSFKRFHPLKNIIYGLSDILSGGIFTKHQGHCHAFIATGDATENGGIVACQATVFNKYIAQRCNFIVDIEPTEGYRFIMTSPPGSLWSQEDWYQNEKGIILTETELTPQGPFSLRKTPKGVRSRNAIQYSDCIDRIIQELSKDNNGLIPNEWLIGDTKTGEIASYQLMLYNKILKTTNNGYYWSCTLAHDAKVLSEQTGVPILLLKMVSKIIPNIVKFRIEGEEVIWNHEVANKLIELGNKYYGQINTNIAKKIISTYPITKSTTDYKITDTNLMENLGILAHLGVTNGKIWTPSEGLKKIYKDISILPASGCVEVYPMISKPKEIMKKEQLVTIKDNSRVLWKFETDETDSNYNYSSSVIFEEILYSVTKSGMVYALNAKNGQELWNKKIGENPKTPIINNDNLVIETDLGLQTLNKETGDIEVKQNNENVILSEQFNPESLVKAEKTYVDDRVYFGSWDGYIYSYDIESKELIWKFQTGWGIDTKPAVTEDLVFVGALDNNMYALDKLTGELEWIYTCNSSIHSNPLVYGEYVFFGCDDGRFYALNKTNGALAWNFAPGYIMSEEVNNYIVTPILSDPVAYNGIVYISTMGNIYALDAQTIEKPEEISEDTKEFDFNIIILLISLIIIVLLTVFLLYLNKKGKVK